MACVRTGAITLASRPCLRTTAIRLEGRREALAPQVARWQQLLRRETDLEGRR